jgi:uncharacterized protein YkwD
MRRGLASAALLAGLAWAPASRGESPPLAWRPTTESPRPAPKASEAERALYAICGAADGALAEVAARNVRAEQGGGHLMTSDELAFTLRAAGSPHVWPRAWSIAGQGLDDDEIARRVRGWIGGWRRLGTGRCGVARGTGPDGETMVAAVAVDALADMAPIPSTARVGQWLTLEGTMLVPTSAAKVVLLGPRGAPRAVVASLTGNRVRSSFAVDQPGAWLVQVLATVSTGPRPVLEALVHAGVTPPTRYVSSPAPGEDAGRGAKDDDDAMLRMVNAARASESLAPLRRDPELDRLALEHSEEMRKQKVVGHDVGSGDPAARLGAAGVSARITGENVASASTLEGAHRALWASPSHRGNLLLDQFSKVGVAVVRGPDGAVWVTELFTG